MTLYMDAQHDVWEIWNLDPQETDVAQRAVCLTDSSIPPWKLLYSDRLPLRKFRLAGEYTLAEAGGPKVIVNTSRF